MAGTLSLCESVGRRLSGCGGDSPASDALIGRYVTNFEPRVQSRDKKRRMSLSTALSSSSDESGVPGELVKVSQPVVVWRCARSDLRVRVEIMGSQKCSIAGKSQSVLIMISPIYLHPHPYQSNSQRLCCSPPLRRCRRRHDGREQVPSKREFRVMVAGMQGVGKSTLLMQMDKRTEIAWEPPLTGVDGEMSVIKHARNSLIMWDMSGSAEGRRAWAQHLEDQV
jgi:hypothetical protein|eukprot:SAG25_NODE_1630_length_2648_cov_6.231463_2_plen_224_part_00